MNARSIIEAETKPTLSGALDTRSSVVRDADKMVADLTKALEQLPPGETRRRVEAALRELRMLQVAPDETEQMRQSTGHRARAPRQAAAYPSPSKLRSIVTRATGVANWDITDDNYSDDTATRVAQALDVEHSLRVDPKAIKVYNLVREYKSRSEPNYVSIALTPAGIYVVDYATDRVSGFSEFVKDEAGLAKFLENV